MVGFEEIYLVAHNTPSESRESGLRCRFIRINEQWGIKFYRKESMRNKTHDFQKKAAEVGLAPRIGQCFELTIPFNEDDDEPVEVYGYVTECISETYGDRMAYEMYSCSYDECTDSQQNEIEESMYRDYAYDKLIAGMCHIGITTSDIHIMNVGYLKGKLVCIDFSEEEEL